MQGPAFTVALFLTVAAVILAAIIVTPFALAWRYWNYVTFRSQL